MIRRRSLNFFLSATLFLGLTATAAAQTKDPARSHRSISGPNAQGLTEADLSRRLGLAGEETDFQNLLEKFAKSDLLSKLTEEQYKQAFEYYLKNKEKLDAIGKKIDPSKVQAAKKDLEIAKAAEDFKGNLDKPKDGTNDAQNGGISNPGQAGIQPATKPQATPPEAGKAGASSSKPAADAQGDDGPDPFEGISDRLAEAFIGMGLDPNEEALKNLIDALQGNRAFDRMEGNLFSGRGGDWFAGFRQDLNFGGKWDMPRFDMPSMPSFPNLSLPSMPSMPAMPNWGGGLPGAPAMPDGAGAAGIALLEVLLWVVLGIGVCVLAWKLFNRAASGETAEQRLRRLGSWPVNPRYIRTRGELVAAFEYLTLLLLGFEARMRNHVEIAHEFAGRQSLNPEMQRSESETLAWLYEQARYAPETEPLTADDLADARRALCYMAGVAAV